MEKRKELQRELDASNEKLNDLEKKIKQVFEVERKHVADLCEIEGFIENETEEERIERERKEEKGERADEFRLMQKLEASEAKNVYLEKEIKEKEYKDKEEDRQEFKDRLMKAFGDLVEKAFAMGREQ